LTVPKARTNFGKKASIFAAPSAWNQLQNELVEGVGLNLFF